MSRICGRRRARGSPRRSTFTKSSGRHSRALSAARARQLALSQPGRWDSFENVSQQAGVEMGRWSWSSDFWDFDHDGYPDLYVANGYISAPGSAERSRQFLLAAGGGEIARRRHALAGLRARMERAQRIDPIGHLLERLREKCHASRTIATEHSPRFPAQWGWIFLRTAARSLSPISIMTDGWRSSSRIATLRNCAFCTTR